MDLKVNTLQDISMHRSLLHREDPYIQEEYHGLERIAEELMGRRKWKLYQESMSRNYLQPLNNIKTRTNEVYHKDHGLDQQTKLEVEEHSRHSAEDSQPPKGQDPVQDQDISLQEDSSGEQKESRLQIDQNSQDGEGSENQEERLKELQDQQEAEDRLKDWAPQKNCYFCVDGKLDAADNNHGVLSPRQSESDTSDSHSEAEAPPTLTPAGLTLNNHTNNQNNIGRNHRAGLDPNQLQVPTDMTTTLENIAALTAFLAGNRPETVAQLPFHPMRYPRPAPWYVSSSYPTAGDGGEKAFGQGEQPLDLSSKGGAANNNNNGSSCLNDSNKLLPGMRLSHLDTKHIFNSDSRAKPRMTAVAGRRTYTEDELQAALRDIQSGKLGTRRAAVIYGIPRSTLRNKVYKLALERERESHLNPAVPLKIDEEEAMDEDKDLSGAEEEKEVEKALEGPLLSMEDILRFSSMENPETLKNILLKSREAQPDMPHLETMGPFIQNLIMASRGLIPGQKPLESDITAMIPELVKRMITEDQLVKLQNNGDSEKLMRPSPSNSVVMKTEKARSESDMDTEDSSSNVILKIPSFKPTTSKNGTEIFRGVEAASLVSPTMPSDSNSPPIKSLTNVNVKDVLAKNIKVRQSPEPLRLPTIMEPDFKGADFTPPLIAAMGVMKPQQTELPRPYQPPTKPPQNNSNANQNAPQQGGKGTRPKRGKYRNYDRDSLVEAVRAVQRGEMSVHRAGSYYGVPHSTLEYKVKERHLMRPRKRDPKPNPVDEKIASLKQNDLRAQQEKVNKPPLKPPQKFPPTSPNGVKIPMFDPSLAPLGYNPPPFPFWHPGFPHIPLDYARTAATAAFPTSPEFFATQMMQKLQEESSRTHSNAQNPTPTLAKSARQIAESLLDAGGSNGFLDGIIRSSLESGVPGAAEDKSPKEEKNLAPENMSNKALLDQLCRNSRLTPLSKPPTVETASLGEELVVNVNNGESQTQKIPTIELSNDSNDSGDKEKRTPPGRIYLKQELTNPENLKPEMLVRFRHDLDHRNGVESASETDMAQD